MPRFKITKTLRSGGEPEVEYTYKPNGTIESMERFYNMIYEEEYQVLVEEVKDVYEKQTIKAYLSSGREVILRGFSFRLTYREMIEGDPDKYINEENLESLEKEFEGNYMPTVVRRPELQSEHDDLPVFCLISEWVRYSENPGEKTTELRVISFTDHIETLSLQDLLQLSLDGLDWDRYAKRFDASDL